MINNKISSIEKSTALLKKNLENLENADKAINKTLKKIIASKSEKKDVNKAIAETNKKLDPIQTDLTKYTSDFKQELEKLSGTVDETNRKIDKFQADLATLSSDLIGPKELALALKAEQIVYQRKLTQTSKNFENQIAATRKALKELDRRLKLSNLQQSVKSEGSVPAEKLEVEPASPETPPESGKIFEQDIQ
jgi:predicted  nucleic acid-binding Zn-ribbon protein